MKKKKGFTIVEVLISSALALLIMGAALAIWLFIQGIWHTERVKSELLGNIQLAMERIKQEVMFSDGNQVLTATAGLSFPRAFDSDSDGFIELDASNNVIWDETFVYHTYDNNGSLELRKTVFQPRNGSLTLAQREAQLAAVITNGTGAGAEAAGEIATTYTIISGLKALTFDISPQVLEFDGYAASVERSNNVSFGSIVLAPGYHTITFKVTDDNDGAEAFGIDSFSVTPSGSTREAEDYISLTHLDGSAGVSASSGDTITKEDMIADGVWGGNYQLDYNADAIDDYITLRFYYDLWRETNFNQGSLDSLEVKFSNENGAGGASGDDDYVLCLEGNETEETQGTKLSQDITPGTGDDTTYRVVVTVPSNGMLCSIKFSAGTSAPLTIEEAYISERESGQDGGTCYPVTFSNCQLDPRNAAQGVTEHNEVAGVSYGITIPATKFGWSNSISIDDSGTTEAEFFEGDKEYFLTFYLAGLGAGESMSIAYWASGSTRSYTRSGDWAGTDLVEEDWGAAGTEDTDLYTVEEVGVSYMNEGTYTSQIYDTSMDDPQFDKIVWNIKRDNAPDANVVLRVRSNDSSDALANDSDWSDEFSVNTNSLTNGNSSISSIAGGRYVQFQAALYSYESGEDVAQQTNDTDDDYDDDEDYDLSCILEDITITWPGQQRSVDVSGYYTLKPTYGKFTVKVDGQDLNKGLETKLTATRGSYAGRGDLSCSLQTEMELRNTGK